MKYTSVCRAAAAIARLQELGAQRTELAEGDRQIRATFGGVELPKVLTEEFKGLVDEWLTAQQRILRAALAGAGVTGLPEIA